MLFEKEPMLPLAGDTLKVSDRIPSVDEGGVELEVNWDRASANEDYIFIPGRKPVYRKHKNVFTDMDEKEYQKASKCFCSFVNHLLVHGKTEILDPTLQAQLINQNPDVIGNLNPSVLSALQDASKIKKKIYIPQTTGVNYIGMLIGPKGLYQKRLEEESGCKILIRGKGSQKQGSAPQPDDEDE
jgi:hypothetical protein